MEDRNDAVTVEFRRARTKEQIQQRRQEIIDACEKLYLEGGLEAVSFKAISDMTSFTRQSIYTYYRTKEEILLDLLQQESKKLEDDICEAMVQFSSVTQEEFAMYLTSLFSDHGIMLELLSMYFNTLEGKCRMERLVEYRDSSLDIYHLLIALTSRYFSQYSKKAIRTFVGTVFALAVGLYPMNHMSQKQLKAEKLAGAFFVYPENYDRRTSFATTFYDDVLLLLEGMKHA